MAIVDLTDRPVVITGAARGLGAAYARECCSRGAPLVLVDLDEAGLQSTSRALRASGGDVEIVCGDVSQRSFVEAVAERCRERFGGVAGWVNNAGIEILHPIDAVEDSAVKAMISVNLVGTIFGTVAAARAMTPGGSIVNVISGAQFGMPHLSVYGATKGGVASFSFAAALELEDRRIRVNAVSPLARTRMSDSGDDYFTAATGQQTNHADSLNDADDCAALVSFLLSDSADAVTGQSFRFDGRRLSLVSRPSVDENHTVTRSRWSAEAIAEAVAEALAPGFHTAAFLSHGFDGGVAMDAHASRSQGGRDERTRS